jgi:hypothetical protein
VPTNTSTFTPTQIATSTPAPTNTPTITPTQIASPTPTPIITSTSTPTRTATSTPTQIEYTLTIIVSGSGSVTKNPDKTTYQYGDVVQLTALPSSGWSFSAWSGDLTGSTNPVSITIDANKSVTANFTELSLVTLTINQTTGGTIIASPAGPYHMNDVVTLLATANSDYTFLAWTGDASGNTNPTRITMNGNKTVGAYFQQGMLRESFDSLTRWTVRGAGSMTLDTENYREGIASIKLTMPRKNGYVYITKIVNWDLSVCQGNIEFWLYLPNTGSPTSFQIFLSNDREFKNYFYANIPLTIGWNLVELDTNSWLKSNEMATWGNPIIGIQLRGMGSGRVYYLIDGLTTIGDTPPGGFILDISVFLPIISS